MSFPSAAAEPTSPPPLLESWHVLDFMVALVEKSLVVFDEGGSGADSTGAGRYRLLETTRQYGAELASRDADETEALRARHRAYYLRFAQDAASHLSGPNAAAHLDALAAEHGNLRVALHGFADAAPAAPDALTSGAQLCASLVEFWSVRGFFKEGCDFCQGFLETGDASQTPLLPTLRANLLRACGTFYGYLNDSEPAKNYLNQALVLDRETQNHQGASAALVSLGIIAGHQGDAKTARACFDDGLGEARLAGDGRTTAVALTNIAHMSNDKAEQTALFGECLSIFRKIGDKWGVAQELGNLAWLKQSQGDEEAAAALYEECRDLREALGDKHGLGWLRRGMAQTALSRGDREGAMTCYEEAIAIFQSIGNREGIAWMQFLAASMPLADGRWPDGGDEAALVLLREALQGFVAIKEPSSMRYAIEGIAFRLTLVDAERAAVLWGVDQKMCNELGTEFALKEAVQQEAWQMAYETLGQTAWEAAFARGLTLTTIEVIALIG